MERLNGAAMTIELVDRLREAFHKASALSAPQLLEDGLYSQLIALFKDSDSDRSEAFKKHVSGPLLRALKILSTTSYSYPPVL